MNEEELHQRIKNAIILLKDGHPFKVGELTFVCNDNSHFSVTGWTLCNDLKNMTKQRALIELNETKSLFNKMTSVSAELTDFIKYRHIQYSLGFDYGMGGLEICNETDGQIKWTTVLEQ
jgi:hypothetical protein